MTNDIGEINIIYEMIANSSTKKDIIEIINKIRPISSYIKSVSMHNVIKSIYDKHEDLIDNVIEIFLLDLEIRQLYHSLENMNNIEILIQKMKYLTENSKNYNLQALFYQIIWYVEKLKGNKNTSSIFLKKIRYLVKNNKINDLYSLNFCKYSLAYELWIEKHDTKCSIIFEDCFEYFYSNGFYRSVIQILCILNIIYQREHNSKKILEISKRIIMKQDFINRISKELEAILYYSIGLGHMIDLNLNFAESFFDEAYNILKPIYNESIYFSNFITIHSFLCTVTALQGKLEQSLKLVKEAKNLLKQEFFEKNLDINTQNQIIHTLNLSKFYVYSRLKDYDPSDFQNLIEQIFLGCKSFYSDFMLLSEFILNANLKAEKLTELISINNFSINRVKHIILFVLQKEDVKKELKDWEYLKRMEVLNNREKTKKTTFIENVFADLLIAKQLYNLGRFNEIHSLLNKYKKSLHKIEVLELRIFMEAFIQVGEFNNGDYLAPALHFMAIKKCRYYAFTRLEMFLLDQQQKMQEWAFDMITR